MDLSILIVNFNTQNLLKNCLQSIHQTIRNLSYEIFVVDNGSIDGSTGMVRKNFRISIWWKTLKTAVSGRPITRAWP